MSSWGKYKKMYIVYILYGVTAGISETEQTKSCPGELKMLAKMHLRHF